MTPPPPEFVASRLFRGIPDRVRPAGAGTQPAGLLASFVTPVCVRYGESPGSRVRTVHVASASSWKRFHSTVAAFLALLFPHRFAKTSSLKRTGCKIVGEA